MREKLNENPLAQVALIGALLVASILALTMMRGGSEEEGATEEAEAPITATSAPAVPPAGEAAVAPTATSAALPTAVTSPPPEAVTAAYDAGQTVVLLIVREGGIDDREMVTDATAALSSVPDVALFVVPSQKIARYAAITEGAGVNRVPALVVVRPKALSNGSPTASVSYGYQDSDAVVQQVVDARYTGRTLSYHP